MEITRQIHFNLVEVTYNLECRQGITDYGKMGARRRKLKYHPFNPWNFLILIQISINLKFVIPDPN